MRKIGRFVLIIPSFFLPNCVVVVVVAVLQIVSQKYRSTCCVIPEVNCFPSTQGDHPSKTAHPSLKEKVSVKIESDNVQGIGMLNLEHEPDNRKHKRHIKMGRNLGGHHLNWRKLKEIYNNSAKRKKSAEDEK